MFNLRKNSKKCLFLGEKTLKTGVFIPKMAFFKEKFKKLAGIRFAADSAEPGSVLVISILPFAGLSSFSRLLELFRGNTGHSFNRRTYCDFFDR